MPRHFRGSPEEFVEEHVLVTSPVLPSLEQPQSLQPWSASCVTRGVVQTLLTGNPFGPWAVQEGSPDVGASAHREMTG